VTRRPRRGRPFAKASRPRKIAGVMNGTESQYADLLNLRKAAGQIAQFWYEAVTFKLGADLRFTPDFLVMAPDGSLEVHEVKGSFIRDDARVKLIAAAERFPFRFYLAQRLAKKHGGGWKIEEVRSDTWSEEAA
jgi:hypothetical protein